MDALTLEQALDLFQLPRTLGTTAAGEPIIVAIGRFGPYIKYGAKYVSLKDDPYTVSLERALECIQIKEEADRNRIIQDFGVDNIQVLNGRYGPYISNREKNARAPKERDPKTLTLEECRALLAAAPVRPMRGRGRFGARKGAPAKMAAAAPAAAAAAAAARAAGNAAPAKASTTPKPRTAARKPPAAAAPTALAARSTAPAKVKSGNAAHPKSAHRPPKPAAAKPQAAKGRAKSVAKSQRAVAKGSKKAAGAA
jgi:DNA topoisomerase-1